MGTEDIFKKHRITDLKIGATTWNCPKCLGSSGIDANGQVTYSTCTCDGKTVILPKLSKELSERFDILSEEIFCRMESFFETTEESNFFFEFLNMVHHIFKHKEKE